MWVVCFVPVRRGLLLLFGFVGSRHFVLLVWLFVVLVCWVFLEKKRVGKYGEADFTGKASHSI